MADWFDEMDNDTMWDAEYRNLEKGLNADGSEKYDIEVPETWSKWKHYNNIEYEVICITNLNSLNNKYIPTVVYRGANGKLWSRPLSDWNRSFTRIK